MLTRGIPDQRRRVPGVGLRRVAWVRVTVDAAGSRCEAVGTGHRSPVVRRIPLSLATRLIAAGVPSVVVRRPEALPTGDEVPGRAGVPG